MNIVICFIIILMSSCASAQPDTLWTRKYGGPYQQRCYSAIRTEDRGFILAGYAYHNGVYWNNFFVVRTDSLGEEQWRNNYGGRSSEICRSVLSGPDGGFLLAGDTHTFGDSQSGWIIKVSEEGDSLWSEVYYGENYVYKLYSGVRTAESNFVYTGGGRGAILMKIDEDGEEIWQQSLGGSTGYDVIQTADEGFAVGGTIFVDDGGFGQGENMYLVKTDADGDVMWTQNYGGDSGDFCFALIQTSDGGYALTGLTRSFGNGSEYIYLVRTDAEGEMMWDYVLEELSGHGGFDILETEEGGFVIGGEAGGGRRGRTVLVRVDRDGNQQWVGRYGGGDMMGIYTILPSEDGGYYFAGEWNWGIGNLVGDMCLVKTTPDPLTVPRLLDPAYPSDFTVEAAFPNPFNGMVTIPYRMRVAGHIKVTVYDSYGREVELLVSDYKSSGSHKVTWMPESLPSGTYMVSVGLASSVSMVPVMLVK